MARFYEKMKDLYEATAELSQMRLAYSKELDNLIEYEYGFSYSQIDFDEAIETLDYGTSSLSFEAFTKAMEGYREEVESGLRKLNA